MDESIRIKVESPPSPAASRRTGVDNGIFYTPVPRDRVIPTSTWDKDNYEPSLVYPQGPFFKPYDPTTSPDYRHEPSWFDIRCSTMIDRNPFADTEGKFNGGVKTALVWDGTYHRVCHALQVGGPFTFEYRHRKRKIRPPMEIDIKAEVRTEPDDDYFVRMSDIPPYREGQKNDPYSVRFEESQDRRIITRVSVPEQEERAIETNTEGDNAMGLDEGVPQVRVKVENTPLGKAQAAPVKSESQETPMFDLSSFPHSLPQIGVVGNVSETAPFKSQSLETPILDLSRLPHHVEHQQVVQAAGASEPKPRPEPTPEPRSANITVKREQMTDENIDQIERMDIDSEQPVNDAPATTALPEHAPFTITIMNVMSMFDETEASSSGSAAGSFVARIEDLRDQQRFPPGKAKGSATTNTQEGAGNTAEPIQYHYPQPKTAGRRIAQPKPTPKANRSSGEGIPVGTLTDLRLRRSAATLLDLFERETQTGKYTPEGGVEMDVDYDSIEERPAKKRNRNRRQRKKAKEAKEAALASEPPLSSEPALASEPADPEADMAESGADMAALFAYAGIVPGASSSELSSPSDSTESLVDPKEAATATKSTYNHPSQRLVIRDADPVPDLALCRAGESIADARARLGLPPREKKERALPPKAN